MKTPAITRSSGEALARAWTDRYTLNTHPQRVERNPSGYLHNMEIFRKDEPPYTLSSPKVGNSYQIGYNTLWNLPM